MFYSCSDPDSGELFIVEGRDACNSVNQVRDRRTQAVFGLQGKVPNCARHGGLKKALKNEHIDELLQVMQVDRAGECRYSKILLLADADADGLHARALLIIFLVKHCAALVGNGQVHVVHAPLYQWSSTAAAKTGYAWSQQQIREVESQLQGSGCADLETRYFKGIASMPAQVLSDTCVNTANRTTSVLSMADGAAIVGSFERAVKS